MKYPMEQEDFIMTASGATMCARVSFVCPGCMRVRDVCTGQEVVVLSEQACCFAPGECVCIHFSGAMTMSLPPQISAQCIHRIHARCCC